MNKTMLIGWIAKQPETKINTEGKLECSTDIAIDRFESDPDVVTIIAKGRHAEILSAFNRKDQIGITGSLKTIIRQVQTEKYIRETDVLVESIDFHKKQENPLNDVFLPENLRISLDEK